MPDVSVLPALAELYGVSVDDMLTGSRRKVFFAGTVLLFLSDAPADIFFLMMAPGIFSSADQVDRWIALFDKALSWFTFGGLVALTVALVWQIIAERKQQAG